MGVSQGRAGQDSVFFDETSRIGALFDGHGDSPHAKSDNRWLFDRIRGFLISGMEFMTASSRIRHMLLKTPGFTQRFTQYGVSAIIFRILPDGAVDLFIHGDCRGYVDDRQRLPRFGVDNERHRLSRRLVTVLGIPRVDGRLNVGRTIGDEVHAMDGENILFPEDLICTRRIGSDRTILITSDGLRNMTPSTVKRFREAVISGHGVRKLMNEMREDDDDASYILIMKN